MPRITMNEIPKIYKLAKMVYFEKISKNDALNEAESFGMNRGSAHDLIMNFKYMYEGQKYSRTNNNETTEYYLASFLKDFGFQILQNGVEALEKHIEYYENLRNTTMQGLRTILREYQVILSNHSNIIYPDDIEKSNLYEGMKKQVIVNAYERNPKARQECINHYGYNCQICNFDFEKVYGEIGKDFIHVHHVVDILTIGENYKVDPIKDLIPVCPNCHAMLHKKRPAYTPQELKQIINNV